MDASALISAFLGSVEGYLDLNDVDISKRRKVRKILHEPLMLLREGERVNSEEIWVQIETIVDE